jgi:hypothetical protein
MGVASSNNKTSCFDLQELSIKTNRSKKSNKRDTLFVKKINIKVDFVSKSDSLKNAIKFMNSRAFKQLIVSALTPDIDSVIYRYRGMANLDIPPKLSWRVSKISTIKNASSSQMSTQMTVYFTEPVSTCNAFALIAATLDWFCSVGEFVSKQGDKLVVRKVRLI